MKIVHARNFLLFISPKIVGGLQKLELYENRFWASIDSYKKNEKAYSSGFHHLIFDKEDRFRSFANLNRYHGVEWIKSFGKDRDIIKVKFRLGNDVKLTEAIEGENLLEVKKWIQLVCEDAKACKTI